MTELPGFGKTRVTEKHPERPSSGRTGQSHGRIMPPKEIHVLAYAGRKSGAVEVSNS
jgi:hypothetical protein